MKAGGETIVIESEPLQESVKAERIRRTQCPICRGRKKEFCPDCLNRGQPTGKAICRTCRGKRFMICQACRGTGKIYNVGGKILSRPARCPTCKQYRGKVACSSCKGTGRSGSCRTCQGTRYITCRHCNGTGKNPAMASASVHASREQK